MVVFAFGRYRSRLPRITRDRSTESFGTRFALCDPGDPGSRSHSSEEGSMYRPLDQVPHDLRFALRQFRRAPGLTFAAVLALACGIGGLTTVFTLVDAVVLRPLPVSAPDELVWLRDPSFSYPMFEQIRDRAHMLRGVFAWEPRTLHADVDERARADVDAARDRRVSRHARPPAGSGPPAQSGRRREYRGRGAGRGGAEPRRLAAPLQRRSGGDRPHASHRGTALHHRRRHPAGLLRRRGRDVAGRHHPGDDAPASAER